MNFWLRLLVYLLVGPAVGGAVVLGFFGPLAVLWGQTPLSWHDDILPFAAPIIFITYAVGTLPALLVGVMDGVMATGGRPFATRLKRCVAAGAAAGLLAGMLFMVLPPGRLALVTAAAGAAASLVCGVLTRGTPARAA